MARVSEKSLRTTDQKLLKDIFDEQKKQTALLERIADVLDVMALEQEALHNTVDEVAGTVNSMLETDEDSSVPFVAIGNNEPIPENLPEELKKHLREARGEE